MPTQIVSPFAEGEGYASVKARCISIADHFFGSSSTASVSDWGDYRNLVNPVITGAGLTTIADGITGQQWMDRMNALNARGFATGAATDLMFDRGLYRLGGDVASLSTIDSYHARASAAWRQNASGIWQEYATGVAGIVPGVGYAGYEGSERLNDNALNPRAWVSSAASLTDEPGTFLGFSSAVRVASQGAAFNGIIDPITGGVVEGQIYAVRALYAVGTSPRARVQVMDLSGTPSSNLSGVAGALSSTAASLGTWSDIVNINHGGGIFEIQAILTCTVTNASARLRVGPDSAVSGENVVVIAAQATPTPYQMPFGSGTVAPDTMVIPAAAAGMAANPSVTGVTMFWRGIAYESADLFSRLVTMRAGSGQNEIAILYRAGQGFRVDLVNGGTTTISSSSVGLGVERTVVVTWRPDGSCRVIGIGSPQTITRPTESASITAVGVGNTPAAVNISNHITRRAGFIPTSLSDGDALALFNAINTGL